MPRGDGSGPAGMGPMTGRAAGYCAGYPMPGYVNPYGGRFAPTRRVGYSAVPAAGYYGARRSGFGGYAGFGGRTGYGRRAGFLSRPMGFGAGRGIGGRGGRR